METKKAVALQWTKELIAPLVIAKGRDVTAETVLRLAGESGIPVIKDTVLADILSETDVGTAIPVDTYEAVAAVFAFLDEAITRKWL